MGEKVGTEAKRKLMDIVVSEEVRAREERGERLDRHRRAQNLIGLWDNSMIQEMRKVLTEEDWEEEQAMEMILDWAQIKVKAARKIVEVVSRRKEALNTAVSQEELDRWIKGRKGRKHMPWKRQIHSAWIVREKERIEPWESREGEKQRWKMQF